jgi:putative lipase involved disintegration of autophagic bodies
MSLKKCSKCFKEKKTSEFNSYKYKPKADCSQSIGIRRYCKECQYNYSKKFINENEGYKKQWRIKNPDKVKEENLRAKPRTDKWRLENKEILKIKKAEYKQKNKKRISELNKKESKQKREILSDRYVVSLITKRSSLRAEEIKNNKDLIEVKRLIIKTKRLCKTSQN